jgi:CRISPR-associated endonuclease/helicase Cas3
MRVLVEQTVESAMTFCGRAAGLFEEKDLRTPTVHAMLGGFVDEAWEERPEAPAILVGTQDMLLSRALARGYAMSRYKWPVHFGLLHSDCLWVLDETQLMGVGIETSAQLAGLREHLGTFGTAHTVWMSATLDPSQLKTIDHSEPPEGRRVLSLEAADLVTPAVRDRIDATKPLSPAAIQLAKNGLDAYVEAVADLVADAHRERGELTLVVVNRVDRAQAVFTSLRTRGIEALGLVHSRFRPIDRARHQSLLVAEGPRVVVATQAVEAGVDISARTLVTELAPWPSLVQRFGRCNRYGRDTQPRALWLDLAVEDDDGLATPYAAAELVEARSLLAGLEDAGPDRLARVPYTPPRIVRPVLRRRDLLDLFDTSPDLLGNDVDVSRFVRDGEDTDVHVYYRIFDGEPGPEMTMPAHEELVRVSLGAARAFLDALERKRRALGDGDRERRRWLRAWEPSPLRPTAWAPATTVYPGQVLLVHAAAGGYDPDLGWTGQVFPSRPLEPVVPETVAPSVRELMDSDPRTSIDRWVRLAVHLSDVAEEATEIVEMLDVSKELKSAVITAALWHDLGKAHAEFQLRLVEPVRHEPALAAPDEGPWAKSSHDRRPPKEARPYFRHELVSALAWLQAGPRHEHHDLVAYLIAAHHGKVRLSIRSVPGERCPPEAGRLFARGVWDSDPLPAVTLPDGTQVGPLHLDLSPMQLGEGSWLERMLALRDDPALGPFRLAFLETLVRIADWRASNEEGRA